MADDGNRIIELDDYREPDTLPIIMVREGEMPRIVDEAMQVLVDCGRPIFSRGGALVYPVNEKMRAAEATSLLLQNCNPSSPFCWRACLPKLPSSSNTINVPEPSKPSMCRIRSPARCWFRRISGRFPVPPV